MVLELVQNYLAKTDNHSDIEEIVSNFKRVSREEYDEVFSNQRFIDELISDYREHGNLIIAYDFDDTVVPSDADKPSCKMVVELLKLCTMLKFTMICFTARTLNSDIEYVRRTCKELGIGCDYINVDCDKIKQEQTFQHAKKIFYNIFLDNRAGLRSSYEILWGFLEWFLTQDINSVDSRKEGY